MRGGRARWKVENETFNTLKNQGYHFEHNFGHGHQHLSVVFALLMMLAFLVDQTQQLACRLFQAVLQKKRSRIRLWEQMRALFSTLEFDCMGRYLARDALWLQGDCGHLGYVVMKVGSPLCDLISSGVHAKARPDDSSAPTTQNRPHNAVISLQVFRHSAVWLPVKVTGNPD